MPGALPVRMLAGVLWLTADNAQRRRPGGSCLRGTALEVLLSQQLRGAVVTLHGLFIMWTELAMRQGIAIQHSCVSSVEGNCNGVRREQISAV